jgi:hypothetical protein
MNASVHRSFDQRADVFILHSTLSAGFVESTSIGTITHRLVLEIALSSLITNGAIEGMIGEKELHNAFSSLVNQRRIRLNHHTRLYWPGTGGNRLRGTFDFDETHTTCMFV